MHELQQGGPTTAVTVTGWIRGGIADEYVEHRKRMLRFGATDEDLLATLSVWRLSRRQMVSVLVLRVVREFALPGVLVERRAHWEEIE
mgnify:FL=1